MTGVSYYKIFKGNDGYWYWRFVASNGRQISRSTDGYVNKSDCRASVQIMKNSTHAPVIED
ncbi:MAG: DUF1508 domain-containing protein [Planctomycetota bacterium]